MTKNLVLPVYSASGNNYAIGLEIGKRFRPQIVDFLRKSKRLKLLSKVEKRNPRLQKWIRYGERYFPQYMEEIRGIADGSDSSLTDILLINCKYDFPRKGCTTVIFEEPNRIILAHNEDNTRDNWNNCHLLKVYPEVGTPFISFCYPGMIPGNSFSFNAYGIIITNNSMPTPDVRIGCPRHLIDRSQLEGKNVKDEIKRTLFQERASGGSFNIVSQREKRAINIETTSQRHYITEVADKYLHTNHYVSSELSSLEKDESLLRSSISRYRVGSKLLSKVKEKTPQAALDILASLEAKPYSIMRVDKRMRVHTLFTALFDVSYDGITMKVYEPSPKIQEKDVFLELALDDLT
jgi:hypothetical protein